MLQNKSYRHPEKTHCLLFKSILFYQALKNKFSIVYQKRMDYDARKDSLQSQQESETVQIYLSCKNVKETIIIAEAYLQQAENPRKSIFCSKPTTVTNSKADFAGSIVLQYVFEIRQKLFIELYNAAGSVRQPIGSLMSTVGQIFNGKQKGIVKPIVNGNNNAGDMVLKCQKIDKGNNKYVQFSLSTRNLDVGFAFLCFGQGGAQWKLYKIKNNQQYLLYESETREGKNNRYNNFKINEKRLCNNNPKQPIILRFFKDGISLIGQSKFDLNTLTQGMHRHTLTKGNEEKGLVMFQNFKQTIKYDFTDYLSSGMQMAMVVCIDFTASNGIQTAQTSLHYHNPTMQSQYQKALQQVCNIVLDYDSDKLVPSFGFGAKVNHPTFSSYNKVHHCFPLNGSETNPNLFKIQGILQGYRSCLPYLQFSGPTLFAPILRQAMKVSEQMKRNQKDYMVLLILTDGMIHDKDEVKDLLVKCGRLPLSLIIIGIGKGGDDDWVAMHELDDDLKTMTDYQGNRTERDLVQFVQFQKHNQNGIELARQVLQELPRQIQQYHQLCKLTPQIYRKNLVTDSYFQKSQQL